MLATTGCLVLGYQITSPNFIPVLVLEVFVKRQQSFQLLQHENILIKHFMNIQAYEWDCEWSRVWCYYWNHMYRKDCLRMLQNCRRELEIRTWLAVLAKQGLSYFALCALISSTWNVLSGISPQRASSADAESDCDSYFYCKSLLQCPLCYKIGKQMRELDE